MWQLKKIGSWSRAPSKRMIRLPHSEPVRPLESSSMISAAPSSRNNCCNRCDIRPSCREGLSISHSSVKLAASRSLFTAMIRPQQDHGVSGNPFAPSRVPHLLGGCCLDIDRFGGNPAAAGKVGLHLGE